MTGPGGPVDFEGSAGPGIPDIALAQVCKALSEMKWPHKWWLVLTCLPCLLNSI